MVISILASVKKGEDRKSLEKLRKLADRDFF